MTLTKLLVAFGLSAAALSGATAAQAQQYRDDRPSYQGRDHNDGSRDDRRGDRPNDQGRSQYGDPRDSRGSGRARYDRGYQHNGRGGLPRCNHYKRKYHIPCFV